MLGLDVVVLEVAGSGNRGLATVCCEESQVRNASSDDRILEIALTQQLRTMGD